MARTRLTSFVPLLIAAVYVKAITSIPSNLPVLNIQETFQVYWAQDHATNGDRNSLQLRLDRVSGAGIQSYKKYSYGYFSVRMKLVSGNSAGIVTSYYLSSDGGNHDEVDFEFLGNVSGQPYSLQTNIFANGRGEREQRLNLWFNPQDDFHAYSILWNHNQILLIIDQIPFRVFRNLRSEGLAVDYPESQGMGLYSSIFDGSTWATQGGLIPVDFNQGPFQVTYSTFQIDSCPADGAQHECATNYAQNWWEASEYKTLTSQQIAHLRNIRAKYLIYDYCTDTRRNLTPPPECAYNEHY